jgi:hypothetical protein
MVQATNFSLELTNVSLSSNTFVIASLTLFEFSAVAELSDRADRNGYHHRGGITAFPDNAR